VPFPDAIRQTGSFCPSIFSGSDPSFWRPPTVQQLVWLRMFGDVSAGMETMALIVLFRFLGRSRLPETTAQLM
jgi:hypothetical protein